MNDNSFAFIKQYTNKEKSDHAGKVFMNGLTDLLHNYAIALEEREKVDKSPDTVTDD